MHKSGQTILLQITNLNTTQTVRAKEKTSTGVLETANNPVEMQLQHSITRWRTTILIIQDSHQGLDISPRYILFLSHFLSIPLLLILLAFFGINLFYLPFFTIFLPANPLTFFHFTSSYFLPFFFSFLRSSPLLFIHPSNHPPSCSASPYYILFFIHTSILSFFLLSFHPHMFLNSLPVLFFPFLSFIHH